MEGERTVKSEERKEKETKRENEVLPYTSCPLIDFLSPQPKKKAREMKIKGKLCFRSPRGKKLTNGGLKSCKIEKDAYFKKNNFYLVHPQLNKRIYPTDNGSHCLSTLFLFLSLPSPLSLSLSLSPPPSPLFCFSKKFNLLLHNFSFFKSTK